MEPGLAPILSRLLARLAAGLFIAAHRHAAAAGNAGSAAGATAPESGRARTGARSACDCTILGYSGMPWEIVGYAEAPCFKVRPM